MFIRLWDALWFITVLFPLLTGGWWIWEPGLKIEFTQPGIGATLLILMGWLAKKGFQYPLEKKSYVIRLGLKLWEAWASAFKLSFQNGQSPGPWKILGLGALVTSLIWSLASLFQYWEFVATYDLSIFTNVLWNLSFHGEYFSSLKGGINLFADHQSPILWLFAPFFALFPSPEFLLVTQAVALAFGGPALYFLARQYFPQWHWALAALPLIYWFYLPIRNANAFEFHPVTLMLPFSLWGIVGIQSNKGWAKILGGLALLLALGAKESGGPVIASIGLAWVLGAGPRATHSLTRPLGGFCLLLGTAVFLFELIWVPQWVGGAYEYISHYPSFHELLSWEVLQERLLSWKRMKFFLWMVGPLGFLPLLGWRGFLASLPPFLMIFLNDSELRLNLQFHYGIEPSIPLLWATVLGLARLVHHPQFSREIGNTTLAVWILFWTLGMTGRPEVHRIRFQGDAPASSKHRSWLHDAFLPCYDSSASTVASGSLLPHLATRRWIHELPELKLRVNQKPKEEYVSCVVIDEKLKNWPMKKDDWPPLKKELKNKYELEYQCRSLKLWQRQGSSKSCLRCRPSCY